MLHGLTEIVLAVFAVAVLVMSATYCKKHYGKNIVENTPITLKVKFLN